MSFTGSKLAPYMLIATAGLHACAGTPTAREQGERVEAGVDFFAAMTCNKISDRASRRSCFDQFKQAGRFLGNEAEIQTNTQGLCNDRESSDTQVVIDNRTGEVEQDTTVIRETKNCAGRSPRNP